MVRDIRVYTEWERKELYLLFFANGKRKMEMMCIHTYMYVIEYTRHTCVLSGIVGKYQRLSRRQHVPNRACMRVRVWRTARKKRTEYWFIPLNWTRLTYDHFHKEHLDKIIHLNRCSRLGPPPNLFIVIRQWFNFLDV